MNSQLDRGSEVSSKRAVLLVNTKSRRGSELFEAAKDDLHARGFELTAAKGFSKVKQLEASVRSAIQQKTPLIVVGGGDGTFSAIARQFVNSESTLGVLPLGTGNAFARDLGIPFDVRGACETIATGRSAKVDLGFANDDYFLNVATIGLTTRIALTLTDPLKKKLGRFVYLAALFKAIATVRPFRVDLNADGVESEFETLLVVLGNGRYHAGPFLLSPEASIVDGRLSLYALATTRKSAFLKFGLALLTGRQGGLPEVRTENPKEGRIVTHPGRRVTVDGEVCARTPLSFRVEPRSLSVVVPQEFDG